MLRQLVLVTGAPGAGKTTLAPGLAARLAMPLVMKDTIKEALHDGLGLWAEGGLTLAESRRLGAATFEVMWAITKHMPAAMLECNFRPDDERQRRHLLALHPEPVEVYCRCPLELAAARYNERHAGPDRHPAHVLAEVTADSLTVFDRPVGLGPVIEVDTTTPVDIAALADAVRAAL